MKVETSAHTTIDQSCLQEIEKAIRVTEEGTTSVVEVVAIEVPINISFNGFYHSSSSISPRDLDDYAYGAAFAVGVITDKDDIIHIEYSPEANPVELKITLKEGFEPDEKQDFGLAEPKQLLAPEAIWHVSEKLVSIQSMYRATGATHAAVFADFKGEALYLREDVGRHSVVDKLIGALIRDRIDPSTGFVFLSSRCAHELVLKCAHYGIGIVATVSAPTSAVIDFAERQGITLCAFARGKRFTVYTHPQRLLLDR